MKEDDKQTSVVLYRHDLDAMMEGYEKETEEAMRRLSEHGKFSDLDFGPHNMDVFEGAVENLGYIAKRVRTIKEALCDGKELVSENDYDRFSTYA